MEEFRFLNKDQVNKYRQLRNTKMRYIPMNMQERGWKHNADIVCIGYGSGDKLEIVVGLYLNSHTSFPKVILDSCVSLINLSIENKSKFGQKLARWLQLNDYTFSPCSRDYLINRQIEINPKLINEIQRLEEIESCVTMVK